jgi:hypothetical protein
LTNPATTQGCSEEIEEEDKPNEVPENAFRETRAFSHFDKVL